MANMYERRASGKEYFLLAFNVDFHVITPRKLPHLFEFCCLLGTAWGTQRRWLRGRGRRLRFCVVLFGFGIHMEIG